MTTAEEAGASLSRLFGNCPHEVAAPVILSTGEVVASVCERCLARLPASWGCTDCEVAEVRTWGGRTVDYFLTHPCAVH